MTAGWFRAAASGSLVLALTLTGNDAVAQPAPGAPPPTLDRSAGWNTATNVLATSSLIVTLIMPRVFYSDPEVTAGWKARWHLSVLAPAMTLTSLALLNEAA